MFDPAIKLFGKTIPLPDSPDHQNTCPQITKSEASDSPNQSDAQEKSILKKPDKILPCPRCNSLDTKFCYYNNYNVNQPRHFCKNCQRYWTAGGTMRNVPVGAGRRKTKHIASHSHRQPDGIPTTQLETSDTVTHKDSPCDGLSVLEFGADAPLCESMTNVLNLEDKKRKIHGENGEELSSCGSSVSASTCSDVRTLGNVVQMEQSDDRGHLPQNPLQCYTCPPWMYPWSAGWNSMAAMATGCCSSEMFYRMGSADLRQVQWGSTPMMVSPTFCPPGMPFQYIPSSYWGAWSMPWNGSNGPQSPPSSSGQSGCSSNYSPALGKHSRDTNMQAEDKTEKCLWAPKTLRIDDPDATAKSSIWDTLGIKPCRNEAILKGGIFKAFQPKKDVSYSVSGTAEVLQANPAALSRSQAFQEST